MTPGRAHNEAPAWMVWTALWIVFIVWGSTYLAIRIAVETMPPLLMAGVRFLIAGSVIYLVLRLRKGTDAVRVTRAELLGAGIVGTLLTLGGNGLVTIAEESVPSGLAALLVAAVPLWVVVWRFAARESILRGTLIGTVVGFIGVAILVLPGEKPDGASIAGMLLIVLASALWATGSFFSKKVTLPKDPFLSTAFQMLLGGSLMTLSGFARGEAAGVDVSAFSASSLLAAAYLVVFGSLLAFTAYVWLLQHAPISKVATYAYVNPVVAIFLGWLILDETVTLTIVLGAAVIVASVASVIRLEGRAARRDAAAAEPGGAPGVHEEALELA